MTLAPLPPVIDSTMLVTWRACPRKFYYSFCENLAPAGQSVDLLFGGAIARGLQVAREAFFRDGKPASLAENMGIHAALQFYGDFVPPEKKRAKAWEGLLLTMDAYFRQWPLATDPAKPFKNAIEFSFALPMPGTRRPDGKPWIYCGRFDMFSEIDTILHIVDEKTTGSSFSFSWADSWTLRNQFLGYVWGAQQHGFRVNKVLVRGISVLLTKIEFAQAIVTVHPHLIDRWLRQTQKDLNTITQQWESGYFDFNLGDTCTAYGGCAFATPCSTPEPSDWYSMFAKRDWDPLRQNPEVMKDAA
jgi:hypothetical protein